MTTLIVQCKLEAVQRDVNSVCRRLNESNIDIRFLTSRFTNIISITEAMIEKNTSKMNFTEDLRMNLLSLNAKSKQIAAIKDYVGPSRTSSDIEINNLRMVAEALSIVKDKLAGFKHLEVMDSLIDDHLSNMQTMDIKAQLIEKQCDILESFLRWFKAKAEDADINLNELANREPNKEITQKAHNLMVSVLDVCRLGKSSHARLLFLLEIVTEFGEELGTKFVKEFLNIPCWIFLTLFPQLFSYLNDDSNAFYLPIIERLLEMYPEPMIYALSVATDEAGGLPQQSSNRDILRSMLNNKCDNCSTHLKFIRSMECLLNPDQRLRSWLESLYLNV